MKILIVGGNGTIGKSVADHYRPQHEVLVGGRNSGDVQVDITDSNSISKMYEDTGNLDAIVNIAGEAKWAYLKDLTEEDFYVGIGSKLMGQVNLVRLGLPYLNPGGSFTLSTGILADDPVIMTTSASLVNGAVNSFVQAAALEMDQGRRINVIAAGLVEESVDRYIEFFPGHTPVAMHKVVTAYERSISGWVNGQIIRIYN